MIVGRGNQGSWGDCKKGTVTSRNNLHSDQFEWVAIAIVIISNPAICYSPFQVGMQKIEMHWRNGGAVQANQRSRWAFQVSRGEFPNK